MKETIKRIISLFLIISLIASMIPTAFASDNTSLLKVYDNITEELSLPVPTVINSGSTISGVKLFDLVSPNYTTYLSTQISVTYHPNGSSSVQTAYIKNLGWHFARINNVPYEDNPLYCIEPHKNYAASTSGNYVDKNVSTIGTGNSIGTNAWHALPLAYREAIALILLYSNEMWDDTVSVHDVSMANNPNVPVRIATQFLIYEVVTGLRDADTFVRNETNGYTDGDIFYHVGIENVIGFENSYGKQ